MERNRAIRALKLQKTAVTFHPAVFYKNLESVINGFLKTLFFAALALQLAVAAGGLGFFALILFRRLFKMTAFLHFAEKAFALHFLFQNTQCLLDVIVANVYLYDGYSHSFQNISG